MSPKPRDQRAKPSGTVVALRAGQAHREVPWGSPVDGRLQALQPLRTAMALPGHAVCCPHGRQGCLVYFCYSLLIFLHFTFFFLEVRMTRTFSQLPPAYCDILVEDVDLGYLLSVSISRVPGRILR